jgi:hypothetical protein
MAPTTCGRSFGERQYAPRFQGIVEITALEVVVRVGGAEKAFEGLAALLGNDVSDKTANLGFG